MKYIPHLKQTFFLLLITILAATGFYLAFSNSWSLFYKTIILVHPLIGILGIIFTLIFFKELNIFNLLSHPSQKIFFLQLALCIIGITLTYIYFNFIILWIVLFLILEIIRQFIILKQIILKNKLLNLLLNLFFSFWLLTIFTGTCILILYFKPKLGLVPFAHNFISTVFTLLLITCLTFSYINKSENYFSNQTIIKFSLALIILSLVVPIILNQLPLTSYTLHLSTIIYEKRIPEEKDNYFNTNLFNIMNVTKGCGLTKGCHTAIYFDHRHSNHNTSMTTSYLQKNLDYMSQEVGKHNTYICGGCHFQAGLFTKGKDYKYFANKKTNGYSCVFCHSITKTAIIDRRKSQIELTPNVNHIKMFLKDKPTMLDIILIRLNRTAHRKTFLKSFYKEDKYCMVCHHLQLKQQTNLVYGGVSCNQCHMQPRFSLGLEGNEKNNIFSQKHGLLSFLIEGLKGNEKNHLFLGANMNLAYDRKDKFMLTLLKKWIEGYYPPSLFCYGWDHFLKIPGVQHSAKKNSRWLLMKIENVTNPLPKKKFSFKLITINRGLEHGFPSAPLDLVEAWLEVKVTDNAGKKLFYSGFLNPKHYLEPNTYTAGGYMLGMDNHLVTKNRVWQVKKKVIKKIIMPGLPDSAKFSFTLPEKIKLPLKIEAYWKYRKLNQDFVNWAYSSKNITMPVTLIAGIETIIK